MIYRLGFHPDALAEWRQAGCDGERAVQEEMAERMQHPRVVAARLAGQQDRYKITLRSVGYRLVYEVREAVLMVIVVTVGKRERNAMYRVAAKR